MSNFTKPGSVKDTVLHRYPRAICQRFSKREYRVFATPRHPLMQIGMGKTGELAWKDATECKEPVRFPK